MHMISNQDWDSLYDYMSGGSLYSIAYLDAKHEAIIKHPSFDKQHRDIIEANIELQKLLIMVGCLD